MRNRPRSAQAASSEDEAGSDEDFPETSSTENLMSTDVHGQTGSELLVAKVQELLQDATYQPEASLQWQIDPDRLARFQELLSQGAAITNNDEEDEDYDVDGDIDANDGDSGALAEGVERDDRRGVRPTDTRLQTDDLRMQNRPRSGQIGTTRVEREATYEAADKKVRVIRRHVVRAAPSPTIVHDQRIPFAFRSICHGWTMKSSYRMILGVVNKNKR